MAALSSGSGGSVRSSGVPLSLAHVGLVVKRSWEIDPDEVEIDSDGLIGEGYFGLVYRARWREMTVCAKKLKNVRSGEMANFTKEVNLCAQIRHPHLVMFLAACTEPKNMCILTEWMTGGSLYSFLHEKSIVGGVRYNRNDYPTLLRMSREIAMAMIYLHASKIIHRDLTTSNILLDDRLRCKVADFGLSRPVSDQMSVQAGNLYYLAPESFLLQQFSEASDVYAFGIILNELVTGVPPFKGVTGALAASESANRGVRPTLSSSTPVGIVRLIVACWAHEPTQRPTFRQVLQTLDELAKDMAEEGSERAHNGPTTTTSTAHVMAPTTPSSNGAGDIHNNNSTVKTKSDRKKKTMKRTPSDANIIASSEQAAVASEHSSSSTPHTPRPHTATHAATAAAKSASSKSNKSTLHQVDPYDRPHTPESVAYDNDVDGDGETTAATPASSAPPTPSSLQRVASKTKSPPTLISPDPNVTPRDVRLFIVCLKKHMPSHDAWLLQKPFLSGIDIYSDPSSKKVSKAMITNAQQTTDTSGVDSFVTGGAGGSGAMSTNVRSRSEGDTIDGGSMVDTPPRPRQHACTPSFQASMYKAKVPTVGELVICRAKRCEEAGATYELTEYTQPMMVGMATHASLTKRKLRSIQKLVTIGQLDVLRVLHVDAERGFVDLSKKDVTDVVRTATLTYYHQAQAAHACVLAASKSLGMCSYCLYFHVVHPLAERYEQSVYKLLRLTLVVPTMTFGEFRECACLFRATTTTTTTNTTAAATTALPTIMSTPRVIPEIARRCEYHRVHLNLARLALDALPKQLMEDHDPPSTATDGTTSGEEGISVDGSTSKRGKGGRSSSSASTPPFRRSTSGVSLNTITNPATPAVGVYERCLTSTLRSLNIEENPLRTLSERIGSFTKLQELNINSCQLEELPMTLATCSGLQRLYAFGNQFHEIPPVIRRLRQLTQLNLSSNKIVQVRQEDLSGLHALLELSLAHNQLSQLLPGSLPASLQTIDLSRNQFQHFPIILFDGSLPNIVSLELKHNQIDVLPAPTPTPMLPPGLTYLEWLDVSNNRLRHIDDTIFQGCMYVTWVNLSQNCLETLPKSLWKIVKNKAVNNNGNQEETKANQTNMMTTTTNGAIATTPVGLMHLNITKNPLKSCTTVDLWSQLTNHIPQFLFDDAAAPSIVPSKDSHPLPSRTSSTTLTVPSNPAPHSHPPSTPLLPSSGSPALTPIRMMHQWTVGEVSTWLRNEGFGDLTSIFEENLITGSTLLELDKSDLRDDLGVKQLGTQKKILKLIAEHRTRIEAAAAIAAASNGPTPSTSLQASPALSGAIGEGISALSLGPRATLADSHGPPPPSAVSVRRANSSLSPSSSMAFPTGGGGVATCDPRHCERVKSALIRATLQSEVMIRPVLLRCVVVLLLGSVFTPDEAREAIEAALAAGRKAAEESQPVPSTPFKGLQPGTRGQLSIAPLLVPVYLLSLPCLVPADGIALIESVIGGMSVALDSRGCGGRAKVCIRPYVVDLLTPEQFDGNVSTVPNVSSCPVSLSRTKSGMVGSIGGLSGEILSALDTFTAAKAEEAEAARIKREEAMRRKKEKREAEAAEKARKKAKKEKSQANTNGTPTPTPTPPPTNEGDEPNGH